MQDKNLKVMIGQSIIIINMLINAFLMSKSLHDDSYIYFIALSLILSIIGVGFVIYGRIESSETKKLYSTDKIIYLSIVLTITVVGYFYVNSQILSIHQK